MAFVVQNVKSIRIIDDLEEFNKVVLEQIKNCQSRGWTVRVQFSTCYNTVTSSIVYMAMILEGAE